MICGDMKGVDRVCFTAKGGLSVGLSVTLSGGRGALSGLCPVSGSTPHKPTGLSGWPSMTC